jgi:molybdopterin adenylyltransferase
MAQKLRVGILTVSDRAYREEYEDRGGPAIQAWLSHALAEEPVFKTGLVPDERDAIEPALSFLTDEAGCSLVFTTGGTGPAPRDVTPEAVNAVCERLLPGFGEQMRRASLTKVPTAILSRQEAGIRGRSLIVSLPGNPTAIDDCLEAIFAAIPDALSLVAGLEVATVGGRSFGGHRPFRHA